VKKVLIYPKHYKRIRRLTLFNVGFYAACNIFDFHTLTYNYCNDNIANVCVEKINKMKTSTILNEKNINASLIIFCIILALFMLMSSNFYHNYQAKQSRAEAVVVDK